MKKWFKDNNEVQKVPKEIFSLSEDSPDQYMIILQHAKNKEGYSYQIGFNTRESIDNNKYFVNLFDAEDNYLGGVDFESTTALPPVWDRSFGYIDYLDSLMIQKGINRICEGNNLPLFEIDENPERKSFYFCKLEPGAATPEEMMSRIKAGERYNIVSVFAEKAPDLVDKAKERAAPKLE